MKAFSIRDASLDKEKNLAYLLYYEREKLFYIEIEKGIDEWETAQKICQKRKFCETISRKPNNLVRGLARSGIAARCKDGTNGRSS